MLSLQDTAFVGVAGTVGETEYCQNDGTNARGTANNYIFGNQIESGNSVIGKECTALTVHLDKYGTVSGTVYARVWDGATSTVLHDWSSKAISALSETNQEETFTGSGYTIAEGNLIGVEFSLSGTGATEMLDDDSSHSGWLWTRFNGSAWSDDSGRAFRMCITGET